MPPLPVPPPEALLLSPQDAAAARRLAAELIRDEPALRSSLDFGPFVAQGEGDGPRLLIGDQSEIPLLATTLLNRLDHRMALLARGHDSVILRQPDADFLGYLHQTLERPDITFIAAGYDPRRPVIRTCREDPAVRSALETAVARHGGLTLLPFLTTGNSWRLAQSLGEATRRTVHIAGPGPRISRRANDKLWFAALARRVLGQEAVPPTLYAFGPAGAAGLVRQVAAQSAQVVVKVPDSAGSAGNIVLESGWLRDLPLAEIRRFLEQRLASIGWGGRYPLLVGVWDSNVTCSPSVQMWLPLPEEGQPEVEGVFEQRLVGLQGAFVGGRPSVLPHPVQARLAQEALRIAAVLQHAGYYGRCSLDAVLVRGAGGSAVPHWIECNGRWGGVSIPMSAAKALSGGSLPGGLVILQSRVPDAALTTRVILDRLDDILHRPGGAEGIVLLSPPQNSVGARLNLMAMAAGEGRAHALIEAALMRLGAARPL